jgi:addiction module HigA family antidote
MPMKNPPHPGLSVRHDCLEPLGLSVTEAAKRLGVSRKQLSDVVNGRSGISPEMAIRLDKAFGGGAETWFRLQAAFDLAGYASRRSDQGRSADARGLRGRAGRRPGRHLMRQDGRRQNPISRPGGESCPRRHQEWISLKRVELNERDIGGFARSKPTYGSCSLRRNTSFHPPDPLRNGLTIVQSPNRRPCWKSSL